MVSGNRSVRGFTLIELILVIVILGILSAMIVPKFVGVSEDARISRAQSDIVVLSNALDRFEIYNGTYPKDLQALVSGKRRLVDAVKPDPWGNPYVYAFPGRHNKDGFDLFSRGADGAQGSADDVTNWNWQ